MFSQSTLTHCAVKNDKNDSPTHRFNAARSGVHVPCVLFLLGEHFGKLLHEVLDLRRALGEFTVKLMERVRHRAKCAVFITPEGGVHIPHHLQRDWG